MPRRARSIARGAVGICALAVVVAYGVAFGSACGPTGYVYRVTWKASSAVAEAKAAKADRYSPYWYTLAVEYLHKAREEAAHADFQAANRFGRISDRAARKAKQQAIQRAADPSNTDWMPPEELTQVTPAGKSTSVPAGKSTSVPAGKSKATPEAEK